MRPGRAFDLGVAALAIAQLGAAFVLVPGGDEVGVTCPSRVWLGVACPFCGMSRSFVALAHGQPGAAFVAHPAGPLLALAMVAFVVAALGAAVRRASPVLARRRFVALCEVVVATCVAVGVFHTMRS